MLYAMRKKDTKEYFKDDYDQVIVNYDPGWFSSHIPIDFNMEDMEVVEWKNKDNFYFVNEYFDIQGSAIVRMVEVTQHKMVEDEQGYEVCAKDANEDYLWQFNKKPQVNLISGSASYGFSMPTDEGYHSETIYVREGLDDEGQPVWLIDISTDSRDCDGRMEHHYFMKSKGGLKDLKEEAKRYVRTSYNYINMSPSDAELAVLDYMNEHAQEEFQSDMVASNHGRSYQRDYSAEAMGY